MIASRRLLPRNDIQPRIAVVDDLGGPRLHRRSLGSVLPYIDGDGRGRDD